MVQTMVKWSSLTPQLDQQPTTPAIRITLLAVETAPALVKLMENGLGAHPLVNVSKTYHLKLNLSVIVTMRPEYFSQYKDMVALCVVAHSTELNFSDIHYGLLI